MKPTGMIRRPRNVQRSGAYPKAEELTYDPAAKKRAARSKALKEMERVQRARLANEHLVALQEYRAEERRRQAEGVEEPMPPPPKGVTAEALAAAVAAAMPPQVVTKKRRANPHRKFNLFTPI